jgi:hypothetical protein
VRHIIIPLLQFDTHILLAEAMTKRKKPTKTLPIKAILTTQLFEEKQLTIIIHKRNNKKPKKKLHWAGLSKGWEYPLSPLVMREIFRAGRHFSATTIKSVVHVLDVTYRFEKF